MRLSVGTSGYSYKEWKGPFYPSDLPASQMLDFYGQNLPAVEINNTFYRLPRESVLETWAQQVPPTFRFALKASRRITHMSRLKESAEDPTAYLLKTVAALGDRLGVLLFQLPPKLKKDLPRLEAFLEYLPPNTRAAFEFRHESWFDEETFDVLRACNLALVTVEGEDDDEAAIVPTASYGYLRLRRPDYQPDDLARWAADVRKQSWDEAFVFFKHEDAGAGPAMAQAFLDAAGREDARRQPRSVRPKEQKREVG